MLLSKSKLENLVVNCWIPVLFSALCTSKPTDTAYCPSKLHFLYWMPTVFIFQPHLIQESFLE